MNLINTSNCNKCTGYREETQLHMFYECDYVKPLLMWVMKCLSNTCNFTSSSNIRFIFFDNLYANSHQKTICNIFIFIYIITIWRTRKENLRIGDLKYTFMRRLSDYKTFLQHMPTHKCKKLSEELSMLHIGILKDF